MNNNLQNNTIWSKVPILAIFLLLTVTFTTIKTDVYAADNITLLVQSETVTLNIKDKSIDFILAEIESQTGIGYYIDEEVSEKLSTLSINVTNVSVEEALKTVLKDSGYTFEIVNSAITIVKDNTPKPAARNEESKSHVINGRVMNDSNEPLVGAMVVVRGTNEGAITDDKGAFALVINKTSELEVSFMGYLPKTEKVTNTMDNVVITLEVDAAEIDDVMVVAYGTTTKRSTTGSISQVTSKDIEGVPSASIATLLQGKVAGLDITQMSGAPGGGGTSTVIRGYNSLDVEQGRRFSNPLWIVDGVPMNSFTSPVTGTNMLSDLNPDMIESIQVLKDASAAALYGSRAANGVIIVTTKKGKKNQKARFQANFSQSWNVLPELPALTTGVAESRYRMEALWNAPQAFLDPTTNEWRYYEDTDDYLNNYDRNGKLNAFQTAEYMDQAELANGGYAYQDSTNNFYNNSTNFFPIYMQMGKTTNANIQAYGGNEKSTYGIGLGYYDETGIVRGSDFSRLNINTSLTVEPVERILLDIKTNISYSSRHRGNTAAASGAAVETVPGDAFKLSTILPGEGTQVWNDMLEAMSGIQERNENLRFVGSATLRIKLSKHLSVASMISSDVSLARQNRFTPSTLSWDGYSASEGQTGLNIMMLNENFINYKRTIAGHGIDLMLGASYQYDRAEYNFGSAMNGPSDKIEYAPEGMPDYIERDYDILTFKDYISDMTEKTLVSFFGRFEYNYKEKYYLSIAVRRDGSSVFGANNKWALFPSVAGNWIFSDENFMKGASHWLSLGKIRASWGKSGMTFDQPYLALGLLQVGSYSYLGNPTLEPVWKDGYYNPNLRWEETAQTDIGIDLEMFDRKLQITADYYNRVTTDLLYPITLPGNGSYTGYQQQWSNSASIANNGFELMVKYDFLNHQDFFGRVSFTGARNWNRFLDSYNGRDLGRLSYIIGEPLNGVYAYEQNGFYGSLDEIPYVMSENGSHYISNDNVGRNQATVGNMNIDDINGDRKVDADDMIYIGSALPEFAGGAVLELRYKNFDFSMNWMYQLGRHMINYNRINTAATDITPQGAIAPILMDVNDITHYATHGDRAMFGIHSASGGYSYERTSAFVEKVNYVKLKSLVLGYTLNMSTLRKFGLSSAKIFISGENLLSFHNYSGLDPETVNIASGVDNGTNYPLARKLTIGLTVNF